jgi:2-C-methyl-D-erythritol 4-phosphate cytidylyltransferase
MNVKAILLLGGMGTRVSSEKMPKQFLPLGEKKIYEVTLETFEKSNLFQDIVLVSPENHYVKGSVIGGKTRQESSYQGLLALGKNCEYVLIHDAVRPFVSKDILERNIKAVEKHNAVNTCIPSADTLNIIEDGFISKIPDRNIIMRGQTPQTFSYPLILDAHRKTKQTNAFDDCSLVLEMNHKVFIVEGSSQNFKITTDFDYFLAKNFYEKISLNS